MNTQTQPKRAHRAIKLLALAVVLLMTAAACSSSSGTDSAAVASTTESAQAAPAVTPDDAMADDAMAEEEDAMADDAMADEEDAMAEDAMEDDAMEEDAMADDAMAEDGPYLALDFAGLETLGDAAVYEGWVIVDGSPVSTGRFNIDADGEAIAEDGGGHVFEIPAGVDASTSDISAVVISIEPTVDPDPAPAATKVLGGEVVDGTAELTIAHPAALGTDFADASGVYILGTPTDGDGNNELSGVWFIDLPLAQGLDLPELPAGWAYEGWAVIDGVPVSTGRFVDPGAADDFDGFSGDQGGPNYPGEDFIVNAPDGLEFPTDLTESTIVISVEPDADDSPAPFALKPLVSEVADGIADHVVQSLGAGPAAPTGTATIGG